jgi:hypothetical protein
MQVLVTICGFRCCHWGFSRICGPKCYEETRKRRKLWNKNLYNLYSSVNFVECRLKSEFGFQSVQSAWGKIYSYKQFQYLMEKLVSSSPGFEIRDRNFSTCWLRTAEVSDTLLYQLSPTFSMTTQCHFENTAFSPRFECTIPIYNTGLCYYLLESDAM